MAKSKYQAIKEEAYKANMQIPEQHLALYTWGNVSAFDPELGVFAIKPSGVPYPELTVDSMVVCDLDGNVVEGKFRPSSDTATHAVLYKEFAVSLEGLNFPSTTFPSRSQTTMLSTVSSG